MSTLGYVPGRRFERVLRTLLAEAYTPEGVEIVMTSRLSLDGESRYLTQYVAQGDGDLLLEWA